MIANSAHRKELGIPVRLGDGGQGVNPKWLLWVDGVGGYLLAPGDEWIIGGPSGAEENELCIRGDLSRREACLRRQGDEYVLQPLGSVQLGARRLLRPELLRDGDRFTLGGSACLEFSLPHPLSSTAGLKLMGRQRFQPRCDGVLLVADTCILASTRTAHLWLPEMRHEIVLLHRNEEWFVRGGPTTLIDGVVASEKTRLTPGKRLQDGEVTMTLERVSFG